ncbi:MAG TPA: hypothetical protein VD731_03055 [Nitrosopumilaceae archaeon]|nr:hypothetical protein [Nitrosopumilaceae archaeon]
MSQTHIHKEGSTIIKKILVVLTVGILLGTTGTLFKDAYSEKSLSKEEIKQCEYLYFSFKKLGESEFIYRFSFKSFVKDCLKLYNDPDWTFEGKDKIDKYYEKQEAAKTAEPVPKEVQVTITQKYQISETRYVISFDACTKNSKMQSIFLISSDIEEFIGQSYRLISQDSCSTYWTNVFANSPDSIDVQYMIDLSKYPILPKKEV